jgi:site-specific DNA-cytosine methylase
MHNNTTIVPYISLCSGYEGIGLGLHRCIPNLRCIAYCEREAFAVSNVVAKMEKGLLDESPVFTDVTTFPWQQFAPYMAGGILSFGWPCQPVSMAGKRKATEDERWLFDIIADGISIMRPGMLFAENVEGLLSAKMPDGSSVFGHCVERLERLHYKVEAGIFSASEVGAPHQRKRVFILAHNNSERVKGFSRGVAVQSLSTTIGDCGVDAWPGRPGQPQYGWEPPRTTKTMANTICSRGEEPEYLNANLPSESSGGDSEVVGNSSSERPYRGSEDGANQQPKMLGQGHEAMGNAKIVQCNGSNNHDGICEQGESFSESGDASWKAMGNSESGWTGNRGDEDSKWEGLGSTWSSGNMGNAEQLLFSATGEHGAVDETSGIPTDGEGSESPQADTITSATREREVSGGDASECSEIESSLGRDAYEPSVGVDFSELSGLSHSELAEIREWMVTTDNRTDELRLLGNGCIPATVSRAFLTLLNKLNNE